jgi:predicted transcriptional regulator of viral defense system
MDYVDELEKIIKNNHGTILTSELKQFGIPRAYLKKIVSEGKLERVQRGVYVDSDSIEDEMFYMQKKYPELVYSHETALYLHDLTDRTPFEYTATVSSGYKVVENISSRFKIYYVKKELHKLGVEKKVTIFGNTIETYDVERTICDIVRSRSRIDIQIFNDAIKRYARLEQKDILLLMEYADKLSIKNILRKYMEILL